MSELLDDLAEQALSLKPLRGVSFEKRDCKWRVQIRHSGRSVILGFFADLQEANAARRAAEVRFHGYEHASRELVHEGDQIKVPLIGARGKLVDHAVVDQADAQFVQGQRWFLFAGYPSAQINGRVVRLHRIILPDAPEIDHRDGNRLNCRRSNLRACTHAENCRNMPARRTNKLGLKGVCQTPEGRYVARINLDRKTYDLGRFDSPEEAAHAYDRAAIKLHGEFARLNFAEAANGPR